MTTAPRARHLRTALESTTVSMPLAGVDTVERPVTRFDTLVAALDLHPAADRALEHVAALAAAGCLPVELVTVLDAAAESSPMLASVALQRRASQHGLRRHELFVVPGRPPAQELVDRLAGRAGALLVMATRARGEDDRMATITDDVLSRIGRPVLVVGPCAERREGVLLVAVDGAGGPNDALPVVERWMTTFHPTAHPQLVQVEPDDRWPAEADDGSVEGADGVVPCLEQLEEWGIAATGVVLRGSDPVVAILDHVGRTKVSTIVVTSPGDQGRPTHWFRTTRRLIRHAPVPVLVVPAGPASPDWH